MNEYLTNELYDQCEEEFKAIDYSQLFVKLYTRLQLADTRGQVNASKFVAELIQEQLKQREKASR